LIQVEKELRRQEIRVQQDIAAKLVTSIKKQNVSFVGFKLWNNPGFEGTLRIAEIVKKHCPDTMLYAGGPQATLYYDALYRLMLPFDIVVIGEAEKVILQLAEYSIGKRTRETVGKILHINGSTTYISSEQISHLDDLPLPNYSPEIYPAVGRGDKIKTLVLENSRGCRNNCAFCAHSYIGKPYRKSSRTKIKRDIEKYKSKYMSTCYRLSGSCNCEATTDVLLNIQKELQCNILYSMFCEVGPAKDYIHRISKASGCTAVFIGMETGSSKLRHKVLNKTYNTDDLITLVRYAKSEGIFVTLSLIYPLPFETRASEEETMELLQLLGPDSIVISPPIIEPNTPWANDPYEYGLDLCGIDLPLYMLKRKINRYIPPWYYQKSGYKVGDDTVITVFKKYFQFVLKLKKSGFSIGITDEQAMIANLAGYKDDEEKFCSAVRMAFARGDEEFMDDLLGNVNLRINELSQSCTEKSAIYQNEAI
jgi:radical SAM superfamily enzyme YgiQ (UPF0313 family)